ncbi:response regulator [Lacinutrix sp. C3R15]|uniref:tetratricopeptide repeat-containing hybrid sensor histidine kinase/response regulator n=1 Tax=Flavobacteriaceae TaxID=49546 RepID=UPI001C0932CE|nr:MULTISPECIES: response regulator [Flavobacteriaceae]MBU2939300.1 response regulator [Lacinutrix sp. C3R15]MDO6622615.1 response regulator [Oceanihabitans sp. 1_MG-2023]
MKNYLHIFFYFLVISNLFSQNERDIISKIDSLNTIGIELFDTNKIMQSMSYLNEAIKLSDSIGDNYGKAMANITVGSISRKMNENSDAEKSFLKALEAAKQINENYLIASVYLNIGEVYSKGYHKRDEAMKYFQKALQFAENIDVITNTSEKEKTHILSSALLNISSIYLDYNKPDEAFTLMLRAKTLQEAVVISPLVESQMIFMFGKYYSQKKAYYNSIINFDKALLILNKLNQNSSQRNLLISNIYKEYATSLASLNKNDKAYAALLKHNEYREKVINEEKIKQSNHAKVIFDIEDYKRNATEANKEKDVLVKVTEKTQKANTIFLVALVFLVISLVALFINYLSKRELSSILQVRNQQLEKAKNEAEKVSKLKSGFISNVSHELRTPLYGVVGLTSLLLENNDLNIQDQKYLKSLKYSGDYLLNLINDVLQIGKIESKKIELQDHSLNLKQMVINITDSFEYQLEETANRLHLEYDNKIPEYIFADNIRLSQILINLLGNSLKFTNKGNVWLKLILLKQNKDLASIRFEIIDDGPGIPQEKQKIIFDNFSQLDRNHNENYQGTGLGLSIAKNLVGLFKSKIELKSDEGLGSKFSFNITFKVDKDAKAKVAKKSYKQRLVENQGKRILIVEDNKINQIVTQNILKKESFISDVVDNGHLALVAIEENEYDLILMDLNMPVMDGFQATKEIRKSNKTIPIIALTASNIEEVKENVFASGFNDIIMKPYDDYEFFQSIIKNISQSIPEKALA